MYSLIDLIKGKSSIHLLTLLLSVLYILGTGCIGNENPGDAVVYYFFSTPKNLEIQKEAVQLFTERYPDIKVKMVPCAFSQYLTKIKTAVAARRDIDVIMSSDAWTASFASSGFLMDLQPYVDRDGIEDDYLANILMNSRYPATPEGNIYALPNHWNCNVLFYNRPMFDAAGLEYPHEDWSWDDMLEAAKKLTRDLNGDGKTDVFGIGPYGMVQACELIWSYGGEVLSEDYKRCLLDTQEAINGMQWVSDLVNVHEVSPGIRDLTGMTYPFSEQRVAMVHQGGFNMLVYSGFDFEWGVVRLPHRGGKRAVYAGANPWSMVKYSKRPEKAWTFLKFMASEEVSRLFNKMGGAPALKSLVDDPLYWNLEGITPEYRKALAGTAPYAKGYGWGAMHWSQWTETLSMHFSEVLAERLTVQEAALLMKRDVDRILNRK